MYPAWSRKSEASQSSSSATLSRLFDFCATQVSGLYKLTSSSLQIEFSENASSPATLSLSLSHSPLCAELCETRIQHFGIDYAAYIKIIHNTAEEFIILIPECRGYDPAGAEKPYLAFPQYLFIAKLISAQVRAATVGVTEEGVELIHELMVSHSAFYQSTKEVSEWVKLQVKCACFAKIPAPNYYEMILNKAAVGEFQLENRDHCKEYLESCLRGGEIFLPRFYYKKVLENEPKLPFEKKVSFAEVSRRLPSRSCSVLKYLPKAVPQLLQVKQGKSIAQLANDVEKYCVSHHSVEHLITCNII
jgi:hypothetical protein